MDAGVTPKARARRSNCRATPSRFSHARRKESFGVTGSEFGKALDAVRRDEPPRLCGGWSSLTIWIQLESHQALERELPHADRSRHRCPSLRSTGREIWGSPISKG